ncbi:MAG: four helix bundle protein [Ignavibacteria bacterium]|nr:four helix bundle protein [Ignavibacteria bacterium]
MVKDNMLKTKSYEFALRIIKLYEHLKEKNVDYVLAKQVLRSGTSIGANVEEALGGQSKKDFSAKLYIAYKEARETNYWIRILKDSNYLELKLANSLIKDCEEIQKIIAKIQLTLKSKK